MGGLAFTYRACESFISVDDIYKKWYGAFFKEAVQHFV